MPSRSTRRTTKAAETPPATVEDSDIEAAQTSDTGTDAPASAATSERVAADPFAEVTPTDTQARGDTTDPANRPDSGAGAEAERPAEHPELSTRDGRDDAPVDEDGQRLDGERQSTEGAGTGGFGADSYRTDPFGTKRSDVYRTGTDRTDPDRTDPERTDAAATEAGTGGTATDAEATDFGAASPVVTTPAATTPSAPAVGGDDASPQGFLDANAAEVFRSRWREVQARFVDEPAEAARDARELLGEVIDAWTQALSDERTRLTEGHDRAGTDTEGLRVALRDYRVAAHRLLGT